MQIVLTKYLPVVSLLPWLPILISSASELMAEFVDTWNALYYKRAVDSSFWVLSAPYSKGRSFPFCVTNTVVPLF